MNSVNTNSWSGLNCTRSNSTTTGKHT